MFVSRLLSAISALATVAVLSSAANAGTPLQLKSDQTQIMTMDAAPGTIVIDDPSVADVTVEGSRVYLHGRGYGATKMVIFDTKGNVAFDFDISVVDGNKDVVSIISGTGTMQTYSCLPVCEVTLHVGDNTGYFSGVIGARQQRVGASTGATTSDGTSAPVITTTPTATAAPTQQTTTP